MPDHITVRNRIVVGVDGSPGSKAALRWAVTQAHLDNASIDAIGTWQDPSTTSYGIGSLLLSADGYDLAAITEKVLTDTVAGVTAQLDTPVEIRTRVAEGHPAQVLLAAAVGARLLVLGSRGHGTFAGILLGSVSQHCVQHAPCPVVVVPQPLIPSP